MIRYTLICDRFHDFDGWFQDSAGFEKQVGAGEIMCPVCASGEVRKAPMAPNISSPKKQKTVVPGDLKAGKYIDAVRALRRHVESHADYVGERFAEEARRVHHEEDGTRSIYGEASLDEVAELSEEGIETHPLPVLPEDHN